MTLPGHNRHPSPSLRRASRSSQARLSSSELDFSGLRLQRGLDDAAGGLWTLTFGGGGKDGSPNTLYFTDGIDGETHGLFGAIESVPRVGAPTPTHSEFFA